MLIAQPDISACGVLTIALNRWRKTLPEVERPRLEEWLAELVQGRFIVTDQATDELLVRTFIKWDLGYMNKKRRPIIVRSAGEIHSPRLAAEVLKEWVRLGQPAESLSEQVNTLSDTQCDTDPDTPSASDGVVVGYLSSSDTATLNPQAPTLNPQPADPPEPDGNVVPLRDEDRGPIVPPSVMKIVRIYTKSVIPNDPRRIQGFIINATAAWELEQIELAVTKLAKQKKPFTAETLRWELLGTGPDKTGHQDDHAGNTRDPKGVWRNRAGDIIGGGGPGTGKTLWWGS